jgi:ubiquitin-conjugating enzyme E2 D/E
MSDKIPMPWRRVFNEVDKFDRSEGFDIGFKDESFLNLWGIIPGPEGSIYEGQKLAITIQIPDNYPFGCPIITFEDDIYNPTDRVDWVPILSLHHLLLTISSCLAEEKK